MEKHFELLLKWNDHAGLISPHTVRNALAVHYYDSIHLSRFVNRYVVGSSLRDIGSGGGFPGIVYAILFPEHRIRLYERNKKKRSFLAKAVAELGIENCSIEVMDAVRETDLLMSRATFGAEKFFDSVDPFLLPGARTVLSWGGGNKTYPHNPEFQSLAVEQYELPFDAGRRGVEIVEYHPSVDAMRDR
ncbi:MAG: class I SAM-dependent methyltransferase [Bdellovibrionaceae bacterium]|nr:class I SAM-dependent methyltransferase [Bdellovibrionales bacterium]MCB9253387.1 class I SAM-dependent methyltransferase [Pseudobdellovibrionaceae bacterium]